MATAFSDRVVQCAEFFDSMLNLIPVVYYYPSDQPDEENDNENEKFVHNKKAAAGDLSVGKKKRKVPHKLMRRQKYQNSRLPRKNVQKLNTAKTCLIRPTIRRSSLFKARISTLPHQLQNN